MKNSLNKLREQIFEWMTDRSFPEISPEKFLSFYNEYPLWMFAEKKEHRNQMVQIESIYGDNWCFDRKETIGHYPKPTKLLSLLEGYESHAPIPPIDLYLIEGKYFLGEGNHRVYLAILLGEKEILADVWEVSYDIFLQESTIYREDEFGGVIEYRSKLYEMEPDELQQFKKNKGIL